MPLRLQFPDTPLKPTKLGKSQPLRLVLITGSAASPAVQASPALSGGRLALPLCPACVHLPSCCLPLMAATSGGRWTLTTGIRCHTFLPH